jgi:hypothetical protein
LSESGFAGFMDLQDSRIRLTHLCAFIEGLTSPKSSSGEKSRARLAKPNYKHGKLLYLQELSCTSKKLLQEMMLYEKRSE